MPEYGNSEVEMREAEEYAEANAKGYQTVEYANQDGGQVGSLSTDELYEVLESVRSGEMAKQIRDSYVRRQE